MLLKLDATCRCDRCGGDFAVALLDESDALAPHDLARLRLGALLDDALATRQAIEGGFVSQRFGRMLCQHCTLAAAVSDLDVAIVAAETFEKTAA